MKQCRYTSNFYATYADSSVSSARAILPILKRYVNPASVVDVGCGIGTWLKVWLELGVENVTGIDGGYVQPSELLIPKSRFMAMDLSKPAHLDVQFDLVQSLEVAEHLPEEAAEMFISFLCSLGPVVLFSAAIPYQGGTNHVNEQWPEYWAERFSRHGYIAADVIRNEVWDNAGVAYFYAQNALLFVEAGRLQASQIPGLSISPHAPALARVHPRKWHEKNESAIPFEQLISMLPISTFDLFRRLRRKARHVLRG